MLNVANVINQGSRHKNGRQHHPATIIQRRLKLFVIKYLRENQDWDFGKIGREFGVSKQRSHQLYKQSLELFTCFLIFLNVFIWLNILGG